MDIVNITEINYKDYNKCLRITNNLVELVISIENEVRIIKYAYIGCENHFREENGCNDVGGHRFGYTNQVNHKVDFISDDPITYQEIENGIRIIQNIEKWTQMRKIIEIIFEENSSRIKIIYKVISLNAFDINISLSSSTVVRGGGISILPLIRGDNNDSPDKSLVFWPYSNLRDSRVYLGDKYIVMKVNHDIQDKFRIGINSKVAFYYNDHSMFVKEFDNINESSLFYPNKGCNYESLITENYLEMQSNSPVYKLSVNNCIIHTEIWNIYRDVDLDSIDSFVDRYNI